MIAKFEGRPGDDGILEVTKKENGVEFYIYHPGEESVGRSVIIASNEIKDLVQYLNALNLFQ
jgi:hypothetical protein